MTALKKEPSENQHGVDGYGVDGHHAGGPRIEGYLSGLSANLSESDWFSSPVTLSFSFLFASLLFPLTSFFRFVFSFQIFQIRG